MADRKFRVDRAAVEIVLVDAPEEPTPTRAPATKTPEGYLVADAYLARDGLLKYSDGESAWWEYRPREELARAAASWTHAPVTDDHPPVMVNATNASEYQRGFVVEVPRVVEVDGVGYLRARLRVTDAELVARILDGRTQLSIGFLADVHPERGSFGGSRYDAVQRELAGNHVASVDKGRAGPSVRILLDGAAIAIHHECVSAPALVSESDNVTKPKTKTPSDTKVTPEPKGDEAGAPATDQEITGPEGSVITVPTWVASAYDFAVANGWGGMGAKPAEPAAPEAPAADETPVPVDPEKKEPPMTPDAVNALVRKRARLERLAVQAGIESAKIDAASDVELARQVVASKCPRLKARADKAEGVALDELVEVAAVEPDAAESKNPFEIEREVKGDKDEPDEELLTYARHLARSGVR